VLEHVALTSTPRKEVLTNLGVLQLRDVGKLAVEEQEEAKRTAEYHILAALAAHGYPANHQAISLLASNAVCVRMTSPLTRYGHAALAEHAAIQGMKAVKQGGTPAAFRNAAVFYAIQGRPDLVASITAEGVQAIRKRFDGANAAATAAGMDGGGAISNAAHLAYLNDAYASLLRVNATAHTHALRLAWWASADPVVGEQAEERLRLLGLDCVLELLWW